MANAQLCKGGLVGHSCEGGWEGAGEPMKQPPWKCREWKYQRKLKQKHPSCCFYFSLNKSSFRTLTDLSPLFIFSLLEDLMSENHESQSLLFLIDSYKGKVNKESLVNLGHKGEKFNNTLGFILHDQPIKKLGTCNLCIPWIENWLAGQNKCQLGRKW